MRALAALHCTSQTTLLTPLFPVLFFPAEEESKGDQDPCHQVARGLWNLWQFSYCLVPKGKE